MRRVLLALMGTLTALVTLFGYRTSTPHPVSVAITTVAAGTAGDRSTTSGATTPAAPQASPSASASSGATATSGTTTVTGDVLQTRWGPVQVQVTVTGGRVTASTAVQVPSGNGRDAEINIAAVPVLDAEAVQAQNAAIDGVSGATVTSDGYVSSLQSALDRAGL